MRSACDRSDVALSQLQGLGEGGEASEGFGAGAMLGADWGEERGRPELSEGSGLEACASLGKDVACARNAVPCGARRQSRAPGRVECTCVGLTHSSRALPRGLHEVCRLVGPALVASGWPTRGPCPRLRRGASAFGWTWRREAAAHAGWLKGRRPRGNQRVETRAVPWRAQAWGGTMRCEAHATAQAWRCRSFRGLVKVGRPRQVSGPGQC